MTVTSGLDHLGLTVRDLDQTTAFFVDALSWKEVARDPSYPRSTVTDGSLRLTLWQADKSGAITSFDRRTNIGLHHVALRVSTELELNTLAQTVADWPDVEVEFMPELMGSGPRKHMMFAEPGGLRIELLWSGTSE